MNDFEYPENQASEKIEKVVISDEKLAAWMRQVIPVDKVFQLTEDEAKGEYNLETTDSSGVKSSIVIPKDDPELRRVILAKLLSHPDEYYSGMPSLGRQEDI